MVDGNVMVVSKTHNIVAALWITAIVKLDAVYLMVRVDHDVFKFLLFDVVFVRHRDSKRAVSFYVFFKRVYHVLQIHRVKRSPKNSFSQIFGLQPLLYSF